VLQTFRGKEPFSRRGGFGAGVGTDLKKIRLPAHRHPSSPFDVSLFFIPSTRTGEIVLHFLTTRQLRIVSFSSIALNGFVAL
jgi:hypothetical protein